MGTAIAVHPHLKSAPQGEAVTMETTCDAKRWDFGELTKIRHRFWSLEKERGVVASVRMAPEAHIFEHLVTSW